MRKVQSVLAFILFLLYLSSCGIDGVSSAINITESTDSSIPNTGEVGIYYKNPFPISKIAEISINYLITPGFDELEIIDEITIDDALVYYIIHGLPSSNIQNDPLYQYMLPQEEGKLDTYLIPVDIVDNYLKKVFAKIDYSSCSYLQDKKYLLSKGGIGNTPYEYDIEIKSRADNSIIYEYSLLYDDWIDNSFESAGLIVDIKREFEIIKQDGDLLIKSVKS